MSNSAQQSGDGRQDGRHVQPIGLRDMPAGLGWKMAAALAVALITAVLFRDLLQLLIRPVGILLGGVVVALTLAPLTDILERWMPRMAAVLILYLGLVLLIVGMGFVIFPPVVGQITTFADDAPQYAEDLQQWISQRFGISLGQDNMGQLSSLAQPISQYVLSLPATLVQLGGELILGFFVSLYWLHTMPRMKSFAVSLFPPDHQERVSDLMHTIAQRMGGYLRGVVISGTVVGATVAIGLTLLGVQYALLLGVLAFLGEFVPNIGPILAGIPAVAVALFESPTLALIVVAFYVAIQQIESYILMPTIMKQSQADIPPLVTTFAVFAGFFAGGVLWAILAIPISGAILTLTTDVIAPAVRSRTGASSEESKPRRQRIRPEAASESQPVTGSDRGFQ